MEEALMQQLGQVLFILGIVFAFLAGVGFSNPLENT